jgi:hypothetical protein
MQHFDGDALHNHPDAYWCWDCKSFTLDCAHLVEPLTSPIMKLDHWQYIEATRERHILKITKRFPDLSRFGLSEIRTIRLSWVDAGLNACGEGFTSKGSRNTGSFDELDIGLMRKCSVDVWVELRA